MIFLQKFESNIQFAISAKFIENITRIIENVFLHMYLAKVLKKNISFIYLLIEQRLRLDSKYYSE